MIELLIVDDEDDVREFAAAFFRRRKIKVATACGGEEAIAKIKKDNPKLVLLDIKMSGLNGIETLKIIRETDKELKVVMVTGKKPQEDDSYNKCKELGVLNYIHKPLDLAELERVVLKELR